MKTSANPDARTARRLPLIAWAALPLTIGLVFAQSGTSTTPGAPERVQPAQPQGTQSQPGQPQSGSAQNNQAQRPQGTSTNYADVFIQKLAATLGISADKLRTAATTAANSTIDQGVKAGDFTADQAAFMKQNATQNPFGTFGGRGGPRHGAMHGDMNEMSGRGGPGMAGGPAVMAAVARALGLTEQQLMTELQAGKTVMQLAQAKNVTTAAVHAAAVNALKTALAAEVAAGRLTQAQADQEVARVQADATFGLNFGGPRQGGMGGPGGGHGRGHRGFGGHDDDQQGFGGHDGDQQGFRPQGTDNQSNAGGSDSGV